MGSAVESGPSEIHRNYARIDDLRASAPAFARVGFRLRISVGTPTHYTLFSDLSLTRCALFPVCLLAVRARANRPTGPDRAVRAGDGDGEQGRLRPPRRRPATKASRPLDSRIPWNELLLRVFREDILACPCGGRRKVLHRRKAGDREDPRPSRLPTTGPPTAPARLAASAEGSLWQDDVPEVQQSLR